MWSFLIASSAIRVMLNVEHTISLAMMRLYLHQQEATEQPELSSALTSAIAEYASQFRAVDAAAQGLMHALCLSAMCNIVFIIGRLGKV